MATLPPDLAVTRVDRLILASGSNWGGYGLVAALSRLAGRNLLPSPEADRRLIIHLVDRSAVDGPSGESKYYVDNFALDENAAVREHLHRLVGGKSGEGAGEQPVQAGLVQTGAWEKSPLARLAVGETAGHR